MAQQVKKQSSDYSPSPPPDDKPGAGAQDASAQGHEGAPDGKPTAPGGQGKVAPSAVERARMPSEAHQARQAAAVASDPDNPQTGLAPIQEDPGTLDTTTDAQTGPQAGYGLTSPSTVNGPAGSTQRARSRAPSVAPTAPRAPSAVPALQRVPSGTRAPSRALSAAPSAAGDSEYPAAADEDVITPATWILLIKAKLPPAAVDVARKYKKDWDILPLAALYIDALKIVNAEISNVEHDSWASSVPSDDIDLMARWWAFTFTDQEFQQMYHPAKTNKLGEDERESMEETIAQRRESKGVVIYRDLVHGLREEKKKNEAAVTSTRFATPALDQRAVGEPAIATLDTMETPVESATRRTSAGSATARGAPRSSGNKSSGSDDDDDTPITKLKSKPTPAAPNATDNDEVDQLDSQADLPAHPPTGGKTLPFTGQLAPTTAAGASRSTAPKGANGPAKKRKDRPNGKASGKSAVATAGPPSPSTQLDLAEALEMEVDPEADDTPRLTAKEKGKGCANAQAAAPQVQDKVPDVAEEDDDDDDEGDLSDSEDEDRPLAVEPDRATHARAWLLQIVADMKQLAEYAEMPVEEVERLVRGGVSRGAKSSGLWNVFQRFWGFKDAYPPLSLLKTQYGKISASKAFKKLVADVGIARVADILVTFATTHPSGTVTNTGPMQVQQFREIAYDQAARAKYLYNIHGISSVTLFSLNNFALGTDDSTWAVWSEPAAGFLERLAPMAGQSILNMFRIHTLYRESESRLQTAIGAAHGRAAMQPATSDIQFGREPDLPRRDLYGDLAYMRSAEMSDLLRDILRAWCDSVGRGVWPMRVFSSGQPASDMRCYNSLPASFVVHHIMGDKWRWFVPIPGCPGLKTESGHPLHAPEARWSLEDLFKRPYTFKLVPSRPATEEERANPAYRDPSGNTPNFVVWQTTKVDDPNHPLFGQEIVMFDNLMTNSPTVYELRVFTRVQKPEKGDESLPRSSILPRPALRVSRRAQGSATSATGAAPSASSGRTQPAAAAAGASPSRARATGRAPSRSSRTTRSSSRRRGSSSTRARGGRRSRAVAQDSSEDEDEMPLESEDEEEEEEEGEDQDDDDDDASGSQGDNEDGDKNDDEHGSSGGEARQDEEEEEHPPAPPPPKSSAPSKAASAGAKSGTARKKSAVAAAVEDDDGEPDGDEEEDPNKVFFRNKKVDKGTKKVDKAPQVDKVRSAPDAEWRSPSGMRMEVVLTARKPAKATAQPPPPSHLPSPAPATPPADLQAPEEPGTPTPAAPKRAASKKHADLPPRAPSARPRTPSRLSRPPEPLTARPPPEPPAVTTDKDGKRARDTQDDVLVEEAPPKKRSKSKATASTSAVQEEPRAKSVSFEVELPRKLHNGKDIPSELNGITTAQKKAFKMAWKEFFASASTGDAPSASALYTLVDIYGHWKKGVRKEPQLTAAMKEVKAYQSSLPDPEEE
ncbi:hypothetical protein EXIGLDRAFT_707413 [Exidia glandulosa HHB12029]|uniref:Uncharacterized protein n=1 Tax=Exidia glandulosa HHB12029 TaxID=1314781 RepID=A0A166NJU8_EXIGL|nr:hypothetical protein EXIGLDRAFT_707413 [Exidia glandulosa HHB12029]